MNWYICVCFFVVLFHSKGSAQDGQGKRCLCVPLRDCPSVRNLSSREQRQWVEEHSCTGPQDEESFLFSYAPAPPRGDYVCSCPTIDNIESARRRTTERVFFQGDQGPRNQGNFFQGSQRPVSQQQNKRQNQQDNSNIFGNGRNQDSRINNQDGFSGNQRRNFNNGQNPYFQPQNQNQNRGPFGSGNGQAGGFGNSPQAGECSALTSFPPEANTGCCGKDPSDADRIIGGQVTEIDQFPWTVLLMTTFKYRDREAAFNCGGSLISARYVLTAAHCVSDPEATVKDVEVTLAEYDKRTFPDDCVNGYEGRRCVKNIVTHAEDVIPHSEFDDTGLKNDIALLRLPARVPYTEFIRPICLPPIDIDTPGLSNIPLLVAGWGRNGEYESNVKQSTIVRLVPQKDCKRSYSQLNRLHLCAAGKTGQDTCKGDSGGPLMILYEGRYFVSGIVSGKRADSPCGTAVPSLYTNVYRYLEWIRSHIRN